MIRVLLADDHAIVRNGLKSILNTTDDIVVSAEASNGAEVIGAAHSVALDIVLLDLSIPGISGADLIRRLLAEHPSLKIVVLSMHNELHTVHRSLKAGVSGYVAKDSDQNVVLASIRRVAAGGKFIDPALVDALVFEDTSHEHAPHEVLSNREFQVLEMLAAGPSIETIAESLHLSAKTISTHKAHLMQKLNIKNNAELVRYAIKHGLGGPTNS